MLNSLMLQGLMKQLMNFKRYCLLCLRQFFPEYGSLVLLCAFLVSVASKPLYHYGSTATPSSIKLHDVISLKSWKLERNRELKLTNLLLSLRLSHFLDSL